MLSSGVVRAVASIDGDLAWRLPFACQWVWPVPLFAFAYFAPESPWNAVRRNKHDVARKSLHRLVGNAADHDQEVEASLAYIIYTTEQEKAETEGASVLECFRGIHLRRTEIVRTFDHFYLGHTNTHCRTVLFGLLKFSVVTLFSDIVSFSSKQPDSHPSRRLTST